MKCPHCHTENEKNATFCCNCNAWILGSVFEEDVAEPVMQTTEPVKAKPKKRLSCVVAAVVTAVLVVAVVLLWPKNADPSPTQPQLEATGSTPGTIPDTQPPASNDIMTSVPPIESLPVETLPFVPTQTLPHYTNSQGTISTVMYNGTMHFIVDSFAIDSNIPEDSAGFFSTDLSGTKAAYLSDDGQLFYLQRTMRAILDNDVRSYALSNDGSSLVYHKTNGQLVYYSTDVISGYALTVQNLISYCIAPSGSYIAYVTHEPLEGNKPYRLTVRTAASQTSFRIFDNSTRILSITDDASTIYALSNNGELMSVDASGTVSVLATNQTINTLTLSSDHRQLLFCGDRSTRLSVDGQPAQRICTLQVKPVAPKGCNVRDLNGLQIFPGDDLRGAVYASTFWSLSTGTQLTKDLYYFGSDGSFVQIANYVLDYQVIADGSTIFYLTKDNDLYSYTLLTGYKQKFSPNATAFAVTQDGQRLAYIMDDQLLEISTDNPSAMAYLGRYDNPQIYYTEHDVLCIFFGNELHLLDTQIFMDVEYYTVHASGSIYVYGNNTIFYVSDTGELAFIFVPTDQEVELHEMP